MGTDISTQLLAMLFGNVGNLLAGPSTAIGDVLFKITTIGLGLMSVIVAYSAVIGTIATAHDGEALGKKWSTAWVPMRLAAGSAMLIPSANGIALIHVSIIWLTLQGVSGANNLWESAQEKFVATGSIAQSITPDAYPIAQAVLRSQICLVGLRIAESAFNPENVSKIGASWDKTGTKLLFGGGDYDQGACGGLEMAGGVVLKTRYADIPGVAQIDVGPLITAHHAAALVLVSEIDKEVQKSLKLIASTTFDGVLIAGALEASVFDWGSISTTLRASAERYAGAIQVAAATHADLQRRQKIADDANRDGWALAGAFWWRMAAGATRTQAAVSALPSVLPMTATKSMSIYSKSTLDSLLAGVDALIQRNQPAASETVAPEAEASGVWGWVKTQASRPIAGLVDAAARTFDDPKVSPLLAIKHLGDKVLIVGDTILAGAVVASLGGLTATAAQFVIFVIAMPLLMLGIGLAVVIPLLPAVRWFSAVLQWLAFVLESMISSIFWLSVGVSHPEGDGVSGDHGRAGWKILLNLLLRPVLLVGGLIAFAGLLQAGAFLLARVMPAMTSAMAGSGFVGVFVGGGLLLVMFSMLFTLVNMAAGLPQHLSETALGWLEAGGAAVGGKLAAIAAPMPGGRIGGGGGGGGGAKKAAEKTTKTTSEGTPAAGPEKIHTAVQPEKGE